MSCSNLNNLTLAMKKSRLDTYEQQLGTSYAHTHLHTSHFVPSEHGVDLRKPSSYPPPQSWSSNRLGPPPLQLDYPSDYAYPVNPTHSYAGTSGYDSSSYMDSGGSSSHPVYDQPAAYSPYNTPALPRRTPHATPSASLGYIPNPHPGPQYLINRSRSTPDYSVTHQSWPSYQHTVRPRFNSRTSSESLHELELDDLGPDGHDMSIVNASQWPASTSPSAGPSGDTQGLLHPHGQWNEYPSVGMKREEEATAHAASFTSGGPRASNITEGCQNTADSVRNESLSPRRSPSPIPSAPDRTGKTKDRKQPKMHECPECQRKFPRPSGLKVHIDSHKGLRPYACQFPGCGRKFTANSNSRRHFRTHFKGQLPADLMSPRDRASIDFEKPIVSPHSIPALAGAYPLQWVSESGLGETKPSLHGSH